MSPGRLKSSGDEVSSPPNTPETDKSLEVIRQKDESRLEPVDEYVANRKSGENLEFDHPVEHQITQTRESDTLKRDREPTRSKISNLVNRSQEFREGVKNLRDKEEKSRFSFCRKNRTEEIPSISKKLTSDCTIGFVPGGVVNLTEEEIVLPGGYSLGIATEVEIEDLTSLERDKMLKNNTGCSINVHRSEREDKAQFEKYLKGKLNHLNGLVARAMSMVLRENRDLFYKEGSKDIGCSSQVKHEINTGDARPVRKQPYHLAHSLKPVVEEQVKDMLNKGIIVESSSKEIRSFIGLASYYRRHGRMIRKKLFRN